MGATAAGATARSPSTLALVRVVAHKQLILLVRYPLNTASQFLTLFVLFAVVFFGGQAVAGPAITDSLDGIIVGFFLFTLAIVSYSGLAWNVTREAQWGTLERLFMSPHGFGTVMAVKAGVNVALSLVWGAAMLVAMMAVSGRWLTIDPLTVIPLAVLTVLSILGIGFVLAGMALLYKRIENVFQVVQFVFIGLIAAPVGSMGWLRALPVSHGSYLTRIAMEDGVRLWEFPIAETGLLTLTAVGYLLVGYYAFHRAQIRARRQGVMGKY